MNRSLERLRTILLQGPQQPVPAEHRAEKAEILEQTVLFLQSTAEEDKKRPRDEDRQHSFRDGFSTCLQRATRFLGPQGKRVRLNAALDSTFAARFARSMPRVESSHSSQSSHSAPRMMMITHGSQHGRSVPALDASGSPLTHSVPVRRECPRVAQQPQRTNLTGIRVQRQATKEAQSQSLPVSQFLWRPWA
ncbi:uncharacterized protein ACJ7VT_020363 [Polymixia lowei]